MDNNSANTAKEINLFPTTVWVFPPPSPQRVDLKAAQDAAMRLYTNKSINPNPNKSARHAWRLDSPHERKEFEASFRYIKELLNQAAKRLKLENGTREFDSWLQVLEPGGYHVVHQHSPNILSGILYLSDCNNTAKLILRDPRTGRHCSPESQSGPSEVPVASSFGSPIVFPGWLEHRVEENESGNYLAYISFNLGGRKAQPDIR